MPGPTIVWFRHDLRLADHPALSRAVERGAVVPLFVWAPGEEGAWPPGRAHRWWLHESLAALGADLRSKGSRLVLRAAPSLDALRDVIETTGADAVYWNARPEPALRMRDDEIAGTLRRDGVEVKTFAARLLHNPEAVRTTSDGPYHVFTPFWAKLKETLEVGKPIGVPHLSDRLAPERWPESAYLEELGLTPEAPDEPDWAGPMREFWTPGERAAHERLDRFLDGHLTNYPQDRNRPDRDDTSRLSPFLHHGELSPRQVWHRVEAWVRNGAMQKAADTFLREFAWREFSYHILHHYPDLPTTPLKSKFSRFEWEQDANTLRRWQRGQTGVPIVDAGMRQLRALGWMHNRVRMIAGSFLTKDLRIAWTEGERWFWDTLVDGDLASNAMNWQWVAGSGPDAQPFFRIFNPVRQGERYDPDGAYVRRWVPELEDLSAKYVHRPWEAPEAVLEEAGVVLGETYPDPIVDHADARERALGAYNDIE